MYHSTTGNTKKVALAIAAAVGAEACSLAEAGNQRSVDILFIGDGVYGAKIHKSTKAFIKSLAPGSVKNAAVFSTYGGQDASVGIMKNLLEAQGIRVADEHFSCKGKAWFLFNRRHPSAAELDAAKEFAKKTVNMFNPA